MRVGSLPPECCIYGPPQEISTVSPTASKSADPWGVTPAHSTPRQSTDPWGASAGSAPSAGVAANPWGAECGTYAKARVNGESHERVWPVQGRLLSCGARGKNANIMEQQGYSWEDEGDDPFTALRQEGFFEYF